MWLLPAHASEDRELGYSLAGLLEYAREHNPELAASRFEAEASLQRIEPAGALPDPVLRAELMDITNQGTNKAASLLPSQVGGTRYLVTQSLPWFGKRDLQRDLATAQADQAGGQIAASWADLSSRIKSTYAMYYYLSASERLTRQTLSLLENLERIARTRYANGLGSQQEVIRVQIEITNLHGELIPLGNKHHHAHVRLNSLLSRPAYAPLAEPVQLRPLPASAQLDEEMLQEKLRARNPQLQIAEAQIQSAEKNRDLTYIDRYPGFMLGIAPTQSGSAIRSWDLMIELNIPLQQSSRRSQEREAEAVLAAADARKQSIHDQLAATLSAGLSELNAARRTEKLLATRLLPQSELTYQSALAGYETGKVDFATLIAAQQQILRTRQQRLKSQLDIQLQLADIERLLGEEL
ncbi:MAG TPA: TolC family protein [Gallionella sp.]|nr:TolC family protein [Gallionella sp.]